MIVHAGRVRREKIDAARSRAEGKLNQHADATTDLQHGGKEVRGSSRVGIGILLSLVCSIFAVSVAPSLSATHAGRTGMAARQTDATGAVEQGKFVLHKFEQAIGEETYKISREGGGFTAKIDFKFTDRGTPVPLSVHWRG